jgi:iron complex outermembrane receptor protein
MTIKTRFAAPILSATLAALFCGAAPAALAQTVSPQTTPVAAQSIVENDTAVGDIIVTARRRSETIQTVPIAVAVVQGDKIEATGSFNTQRLTQLVPTLQLQSSNPRNTAINIRGLGVPFGLTSDGFDQGVGIYIDDVYNARPAAGVFDFVDVDRIEVLRGPQGTLYGKNTTAGAINITSRAPSFTFEGVAEVSVGDYDFKQGKASISGPLSDTVAVRLALSSSTRRGTIYNVAKDSYVNGIDNLSIRGQLLYKPTDDLAVTLAADFNSQDAECCAQVFVRTGATQRPLNRQYAALAAAQNYAAPSDNPFDRLNDSDVDPNAGNIIRGVSARAVWTIGQGTITAVSALRDWDWKPVNDRDYTGLAIVAQSQNPSQQKQTTHEVRYNYIGDGFDFVTGLFYFKQRVDTQGTESHGPASSRWTISPSNALSNDPSVLDGLTAINTQWLEAESISLFGKANWELSDRWTISPGLRLNYDEKSGFYQREVFDGAGNPVLFSTTPTARQAAQLAVFSPQVSAPSLNDNNVSGDFTVSYQATGDILAYATYAKSFKSAGINQNGLPTNAANEPILEASVIKPEDVNHYEAGVKTQWLDRTVTFNVTAFRTDIDDYQVTVNNGQFGVLRGYLANAGGVRSQGVEFETVYRPSSRFRAYANGAYTDAIYTEFVDAPCPPELTGGATATGSQTPGAAGTPGVLSPANCDISGQRLPGVSRWAASYGFEVNRPATVLAREGEVYFGFDGSYRSDWSSNPAPSAYTWVDASTLANFRAGFRTGEFNIYAWVRNAFDEETFDYLTVASGSTGLIVGQPSDPRTAGVTLRAGF